MDTYGNMNSLKYTGAKLNFRIFHQQTPYTACPRLSVSSSPYERGLEPPWEGAAWCWRPPSPSSQCSPATLLSHRGPSFSTTATVPSLQTACPSKSYSEHLTLSSGCRVHTTSCSAVSQAWTLHEKLGSGARSYQGIGRWCGSAEMQHLSAQTILAHSKCQTTGINSAHRKIDLA